MTDERISLKGAKSMGLHHHHWKPGETMASKTRGSVWNWAWRYDLLIGFATLGREQAFRRTIADLAQLQPGEVVLDVGCGTGTLAIIARQRVGETGRVSGIDPSRQMIARALKPEGRLLVVDMKGPAGPWKSRIADQPALMKEMGFSQVETGETRFSGFPGLGFALGSIGRAGEGKAPS